MGALGRLFDPDRVAVVGATERDGAVGAAIMRNLIEDFAGEIIPVNPNADRVFGITAVDSPLHAEGSDVAVLAVPGEIALDVLAECGRAGIPNVVVISAGFGEAGESGVERERRLAEIAAEFDMNLVGPNSLGVMATAAGLNASFGPDLPAKGDVSLLSQSGAFITAVVDWAAEQSIGFRDVVSLGNKAVLDEVDFVREWGADPDTAVIVGYLEGIEDGRRFIDTTREVARQTPVVLIKAGRTSAGARAASSHTGALAGSERAYDAGLRQAGVIRAGGVQELFDAAQALSEQPIPEDAGVAIVTNAGGPGVLATDAVGDSQLEMADFSPETVDRLQEVLPEGAATHNPVDILGDADVERFRRALGIVLADQHVGGGIVLTAPTAILAADDLASAIVEDYADEEVALMTCFMGGERVGGARDRLNRAGIPCHVDPDRAVDALDALVAYDQIRRTSWGEPQQFDVDTERAQAILASVDRRADNRLGVEAMDLLDAYGIPTPAARIVESSHEAVAAAREIGPPVALKVVSPDIVHKTDIGGVVTDVAVEDVRAVYEQIVTRTRRYQPDARILGVQVQQMVDVEAGVETILGVNRDPQFGPLLLFGLGGILVEVLEDTTVRVAPVSETEAREMTEELRSAPLLRGVRGRDPVAIDRVVETLQRLSQLVTDFPAILELDVNPLVALPDAVQAIDIRLTVDPEEL